MWQKQIDCFNDYKCITFDLPGHGQNSKVPFTTIEECIQHVIEILNKECVGYDISVVGHSIGAQICIRLLQKKIEAVKHVVIVSALNNPIPQMKKLISLMVNMTMPLIKFKWFSKNSS